MNLKYMFLLPSIAICLTGCDKTVEGFVNQAVSIPSTVSEDQPFVQGNGTMLLKVSPAKVQISDVNGAITGHVSLTNRTYAAGADMAVNLTINRNRSNPQQ